MHCFDNAENYKDMKTVKLKDLNHSVKMANDCLRLAQKKIKEVSDFRGEVVRLLNKDGRCLEGFLKRVEFVMEDDVIRCRAVVNLILECENCIMASCHEDYLYDIVSIEKFTYKKFRYSL